MEIQEKLSVLCRIADAFEAARVRWAVGASLMLYLRGIVPDFHDIDLTVDEADVSAAAACLRALGAPVESAPHPRYRTKHFLEFCIDGAEVDLMAGFIIVCDGREHAFPLEPDSALDRVQVSGRAVPLQPAEGWRERYLLMGRAEKAARIDAYLGHSRTKENPA